MTNHDHAMTLARGSHQRAIISRTAYLGGKGLQGKAKSYSGRYQISAFNLIARLKKAGIPYHIDMGPRGGWFSAKLRILE